MQRAVASSPLDDRGASFDNTSRFRDVRRRYITGRIARFSACQPLAKTNNSTREYTA